MSRERKDHGYEVGRGRPPTETRFRKGKSGNPKGRPKGNHTLKTELLKELAAKIPIHENGNKRTVPKQRAMIMSLVARAIQGDTRAMSSLMSIMTKPLGDDVESGAPRALNSSQKGILESYQARLKAELREEILEERRHERAD